MNIIFIAIGVIAIFIIYRYFVFIKNTRKQSNVLYKPFEPLFISLESENPDMSLIRGLADDIKTRGTLFRILSDRGQLDLFPKDISLEEIGKSSLASWLVHPNELKAWPEEIEFIKKIQIEYNNESLYYLAYKYKAPESNWASKYGWIFGVVGPFRIQDLRPEFYPAFSTIESMGDRDPEEIIKDYTFLLGKN